MSKFDSQQDFAIHNPSFQLYTQLCNVFYEREVKSLAESDLPIEFIQKRLSSLSFYVKRAAEALIGLQTPLTLDCQNGMWSATQKRTIPSDKLTADINQAWFGKHAAVGLILPVKVIENGISTLHLDCIDEVDNTRHQFHVNEHGWFNFIGQSLEDDKAVERSTFKVTRDLMQAACCGHQWIATDKTYPRTLSLRELLLTSVINWPHLNKPLMF